MSDSIPSQDLAVSVTQTGQVMGRLAGDDRLFRAAVDAFRAGDGDSFSRLLDQFKVRPFCEDICRWFCSKECVLECIEFCGLPETEITVEQIPRFAEVIAKITGDEELIERLADAVLRRDSTSFKGLVSELKIEPFCHLLCHWACGVRCRLICEVVCEPRPVPEKELVGALASAGAAIGRLASNRDQLQTVISASVALNCEVLRGILGNFNDCIFICEWICSWRCVLVCLPFCRPFPPVIDTSVEEMRGFAQLSGRLAGIKDAFPRLLAAVQSQDANAFAALVKEFEIQRFCLQLCHWLCSEICRLFCFCVCPNPAADPWFITVGNFNIYSDIDGTSGKTNKGLPPSIGMPFGGGPNFAFFQQLVLGGFCPIDSPTSPGTQMQYRFLYATASTTLSAAINAAQTTINVASSTGVPPTPFNVSVCSNGQTGETMTVTGVVGTTWSVVRGQDGTTAASASSGASVWINPTPITGPLVCKTKLGSRFTPWPKDLLGIAQPVLVPTFQDVWVSPTAIPDTPPPPPFTPWSGPGIHYIQVDPNGWVPVDLNAIGLGFQTLMCFDTTQILPANCPLPPGTDPCYGPCFGTPGGAPAGTAVPSANQGAGTDLAIIFQATRVGAPPVIDFSNSLCKIHVNNWCEVNNLWFLEFTTGSGCCQPIDTTLSVEFTVDHEEMDSGAWSLGITSCSGSAPGDITPHVSSVGPPPVTVSPRGGFGTIVEDTTTWTNCSYVVSLVTRPGLTTGLFDREAIDNQLTFCICGHKS